MLRFILGWLAAASAVTALWCLASARLTRSPDTRRYSIKAARGFLAGSMALAALALLTA
jgi:hypothetical protein